MKNFSKNLKLLLMGHQMSQTELAHRLGIKPQNVSKYLSGENFPSIENLIVMSEIFGTSIDDMVKTDLSDPPLLLKPAPDYEKVENVEKLISAFENFTTELKQLTSNEKK